MPIKLNKGNIKEILIILWILFIVVSTFHNYQESYEINADMHTIIKKVTQGIEKEGIYKQKFSYILMPYYSMTKIYHTPYKANKEIIMKNIKQSDDFTLLEESIYVGGKSSVYCHDFYELSISASDPEIDKSSRLVTILSYSKQSKCYKQYFLG